MLVQLDGFIVGDLDRFRLVSMASWRDRNPTPRSWSEFTTSIRSRRERPRRSSFHTTTDIALAREREELLSRRESRAGAGEILAEEFLAATVGERVVLESQRLVLGGDPCIPNEHHHPPVWVSQKARDHVELQQ